MKMFRWTIFSLFTLGFALLVTLQLTSPELGYLPDDDKVLQSATDRGTHHPRVASLHAGDVQYDPEVLRFGRDNFYRETFGNEVFVTDVMGIVDGPLTITNMSRAILKLGGEGTDNLRVPLAYEVTVGGRTFKKGELIDTGLDVPRGAHMPLGLPVKYANGHVKVGITCAACHATVDPASKKVVEGAPNADINLGLLMALATNSSAYFTHTDVQSLDPYIKDSTRTVTTTQGTAAPLPDPAALEDAVDRVLLKWPRGNFDSTIDLKANPSQIPDSFTLGDHPYGWSGFAAAGPFHGLSAFNNNVHAQNSDSLSQTAMSKMLFGLDEEIYLGTLLQKAALPKLRYDPATGQRPTAFFQSVDPTPGGPGINEVIVPPTFPKITPVAPDGLIVSSPGTTFNQQNNAMSAYQNALIPPPPHQQATDAVIAQGKAVFQRAGCASCHSGTAYTNHRVIPAPDIGTDPSRAAAFKRAALILQRKGVLYAPDTPVPIPKNAETVTIPDHRDPRQTDLAFAKGHSPGGYKVPGLLGLSWTAPYLHDGGVAAGKDASTQLGLPGTLGQGIPPDPENSLRALIDRELRKKVVSANRSSADLRSVHVQGIGHAFWVDEQAGYTAEEQQALVDFLLSLR